MAVPINVEKLLLDRSIDSERFLFIKDWEPDLILPAIFGFANDFNHLGGGYIIIGFNNGKAGLSDAELTKIPKDVLKLSTKISPSYKPSIQDYSLGGKQFLVLWCLSGTNRPYSVSGTIDDNAMRSAYSRLAATSVLTREDVLDQLLALSVPVSFDDRDNMQATLDDINLGLVREYLQEIKSDLFVKSDRMSLLEICRSIGIVKELGYGIPVHVPVNVGLLFFSYTPERFFPRAWIELVWHGDELGRSFKEYYFKGPLHKQLRNVLSFFQTHIIGECVIKDLDPDKPRVNRFYNYPYAALEEVLYNAVCHKSYALVSPIEIQVLTDRIVVLNHPGSLAPLGDSSIKGQDDNQQSIQRNSRIGAFLKKLRPSGYHSAGLHAIYDEMEKNGSPLPIFNTDGNTYTMVTLLKHPLYKD